MIAILEGSGNGNIERIIRAMLSPSFELDSDNAAIVLFVVGKAAEEGYPLCPVAIAFATVISRQLADLQPDSERCVDDGLENDLEMEEDHDQIMPFEMSPYSERFIAHQIAGGRV